MLYGGWQNPRMKQRWIERAQARMRALGLTVSDLDKVGSRTGTLMTDAVRKGTKPNIENFARLAKLLQMSVGELYDGAGPTPEVLAIDGSIRGHEMWLSTPKNHPKDVRLSFFDKDLVVLEVDTHELQPSYRHGDIIAGQRALGRNLDNLIGCDCICETAEGDKFVKRLARGTKAGTFTLRSLNPAVPDIESVRIAWAAPIELVLRLRS